MGETKQTKQMEPEPIGRPSESRTPATDPFYYGYRTVAEVQADGSTRYHDLPLTQADFLDPQPGDRFTSSTTHTKLIHSLLTRFCDYYSGHPDEDWIGVFGKLKLCWGIPGEKEPQHYRKTFDVPKEGARPCLIVEVMSPLFPGDDTVKVDLYQRMGVAEYIIIKPQTEYDDPGKLIGYYLEAGQYQPIQPDQQGRLLSRTTKLWFALNATMDNIILTNASTGQRVPTAQEIYTAAAEQPAARQEAAERMRAAIQRADAAEAEVARLRSLLASQQ